jgi:tRNA threonylcarbamoyladenosine biosynthesis protein TsaB
LSRILAIDTTSEFGSLALIEDGRVREELLIPAPSGYAELLFPNIERLVSRHGWTLLNMDGFAAASGPGSFTGVRAGLAAAKGLAEAAGVKAAAISNLQAMAWHGTGAVRAPFLDARRSEIYGGLYSATLAPLASEVVTPLEEWLEGIGEEAQLLTPDPAPFAGLLKDRNVFTTPRALAGAIGILATTRLEDPVALDANYVRRADAKLSWRDR